MPWDWKSIAWNVGGGLFAAVAGMGVAIALESCGTPPPLPEARIRRESMTASAQLGQPPPSPVCGVKDLMRSRANCGWTTKDLSYHTNVVVPGITLDQGRAGSARAVTALMAACGLKIAWNPDPARASVLIVADALPGPAVGLAEIGCRFDATRQARQWIDSTHQFTEDLYFKVHCHEWGHNVGLEHSDDPTSLMFPSVTGVSAWSPADVAALQALYGPPRVDPPPGPAPPPPTPKPNPTPPSPPPNPAPKPNPTPPPPRPNPKPVPTPPRPIPPRPVPPRPRPVPPRPTPKPAPKPSPKPLPRPIPRFTDPKTVEVSILRPSEIDGSLYWDILSRAPRKITGYDRATNAHESQHQVHARLRNERVGKSVGVLYVTGGKAFEVDQPRVSIPQVAALVPPKLRGARFRTYLVSPDRYWLNPGQSLYLFDEAFCYLCDSMVSVDDANRGWKGSGIASRTPLRPAEPIRVTLRTFQGPTYRGVVDALPEFAGYLIAHALAVQRHDPGYWTAGEQYRAVVRWYVVRSWEIYREAIKRPEFAMIAQRNIVEALRTDPAAEPYRVILRGWDSPWLAD